MQLCLLQDEVMSNSILKKKKEKKKNLNVVVEACILQTTSGSIPTTSRFHFFAGNRMEQLFNLCNTFSTGFVLCKKIASVYLEITVPRLVEILVFPEH
ncbi:unnamed protein product [Citrullus colocynthis]|uniref:Uncharacterized protein n=1 Tax=Citrullus colocynthis TaxID=252529 RepID=A0ABP0YXY1_9ROSI